MNLKSEINSYRMDVLYQSVFSTEIESIRDMYLIHAHSHIHTHTHFEVYFKELALTILGIGKSEICRIDQQARNSDRISVLQF